MGPVSTFNVGVQWDTSLDMPDRYDISRDNLIVIGLGLGRINEKLNG